MYLSSTERANLIKLGNRIIHICHNNLTEVGSSTIPQMYLATYLYQLLEEKGLTEPLTTKLSNMVPEVYEIRPADHCPAPWKATPSTVVGLFDVYAHNKEIVARNLTKDELHAFLLS